MCKPLCQFKFEDEINMETVEGILLLAVISVEGIHGRSRVRLEADYDCDHGSSTCTVNTDNDVGREICRVFIEFLTLEIGEEQFTVQTHDSRCGVHQAAPAERSGR